jgi:cytochrome c oxidase subunit 4
MITRLSVNRSPPRIVVFVWLGLLALLALTVFAAYLPLGTFNTVVALAIAATKAALVAAIFMELRERNSLRLALRDRRFFLARHHVVAGVVGLHDAAELPAGTIAVRLMRCSPCAAF